MSVTSYNADSKLWRRLPSHGWETTLRGWRFVGVFYVLGLFTSSFDIFGVLNIGVTLRIAQLFLLIPMAVGVKLALLKRVRLPLGFGSLLIWTALIVAFVPNTTLLVRSAGYAGWLLYNVVLVFATVQLFTSREQIVWVLRWYLYSFFFVAVFGILQFVFPVVGLGGFLVRQWWITGFLPRVNGFSYEPSFFVTYLLLGWILAIVLLQSGAVLMPRPRLWFIFVTCTIAMIISSSRSGWIMMALWCTQYPVKFAVRLMRGRVHKQMLVYSMLVGGVLLGVVVVVSIIGPDTVFFLLEGTGLSGAGSFSVKERGLAAHDALRIFFQSPVIGYSLGGVAAAIGRLHGTPVLSFVEAKHNEAAGILVEVLAASGVVGFTVFVTYIVTLIVKPVRLIRSISDPDMRQLLTGMLMALVFELLILQINQNILRPYLWIHIALLSSLYAILRHKPVEHAAEENGTRPPTSTLPQVTRA